VPKPNKARVEARNNEKKPNIGTLDAGKLAIGTITADQIAVRNIGAGKLSASYLENLQKQYKNLDKITDKE
jgi:hypothetical protein